MTDVWKYFERGRAYNNSLVPNQYTMVNTNNEFFNGNQWLNMPDNEAVRRLPTIAELSSLTHHSVGGKEQYILPDDCWNLMTGGLLYKNSRRYERFFGYRLLAGGRVLELPARLGDEFAVEYWRYPELVDDDTDEDQELDNTPDVHECIVYYVASYLLLYDDPYRAEIFKKQYTERLARLKEPVWVEPQPIHNQYFMR